ncbi:MAG: amidohydrolase [Xanthomonadales bacterium]|nr:amidohydrolase [Xanthomonadales bacterium]|tara:strand:+ start:5569 stop:8895 length:3327 start_codon:yes stop_codon:yes gene_type:complete
MLKFLPIFSNAVAASVLALGLALPVGAQEPDDGDNKESWSVQEPPGEWRPIDIDSDEVSWSTVDVSPDGAFLVFDFLGDLYRLPIAGGDAVALTSGIAWDFQPAFSPDGTRIAFISDRSGVENVWTMDVDGENMRQVTDEREHLLHNPAWAPDGEFIAARKAYVSTRSIPAGSIWLYHRSGGGGVELVERLHGEQSQKNIAEPAFSPDGRYLYFSQDTTGGSVWQYNKDANQGVFAVRRLDRETGETETVISGPGGAVRPVLSPDGKRLAFVRRNPTELTSRLMVKDLESGIETTVAEEISRDMQETSGDRGNYPGFDWMPDGRSLVLWSQGKLRRFGIDGSQSVIDFRVRDQRMIQPALRQKTEVAPETVDVNMLRWNHASPNGELAVYQALGYIWMHDLGSGERRRLTRQDDHWEFYPRFSPDGRSVVFTTFDDEYLGSVRIEPVGRGRGQVLTTEPGHYVEPSFSPDGKQVVFRKTTGGYLTSPTWSERPGLYIVDVDNGEPRRILDKGSEPQFSADGKRILFSERVDGTDLALNSVNLDGEDPREHLLGDWVTGYRVSPDGRWVAFTEHYNAFVAPFFPAGKRVSVGGKTSAYPVRQVSARGGEVLHWSGDSKVLGWSYGQYLYRRPLTDAFAFLQGAPEALPEPATEGRDLSFEVEADKPGGRIALVGARIVTMRDAYDRQEVIENGTILVNGNRIEAVGASGDVEIPDGYRSVDVAGHTVIPGLVDAHAHGAMSNDQLQPRQNWMQYANLAFGVTTIHDPSNDNWGIFSMAELQRTGESLAPRIFSTGRILYGALAPGATARVDDYEDALFHVRRQKEQGAISVKSYNYLGRDQRQQVLEAARELDMIVVPEGGMRLEQNLTQIVDGHTGIEHSLSVKRIYDDIDQLWSQTGVFYSPTFVVAYGGLMGEEYWYDTTEVWKNEKLMSFTPESIVFPRSIRRPRAPEAHYNHFFVAEEARELNALGVPVVIGAHGQLAGLGAHWEFWMMEQGGFSPFEALRGATIDGARYFGMDAEIGSIEPGKLADLVVIDGNPLENIRDSQNVVYTMLNGRLYDASNMNQVAPKQVEREPFFFERQGGDAWIPATHERFERQAQALGWRHEH